MTGKQVYPVSPEVAKQALLNREQYEEMYEGFLSGCKKRGYTDEGASE